MVAPQQPQNDIQVATPYCSTAAAATVASTGVQKTFHINPDCINTGTEPARGKKEELPHYTTSCKNVSTTTNQSNMEEEDFANNTTTATTTLPAPVGSPAGSPRSSSSGNKYSKAGMRLLFEDKRYTMLLMIWWLIVVLAVFYYLGAFHMHFMTFGPSPETVFMGMTIDTWFKWHCLAQFSFWNTAINEFLSAAIVPWITNGIMDHKSKYLPYSKMTCIYISNFYCTYGHIMSVFSVFLFFSQIDFLIIRTIADLIVTTITTAWWMQSKTVDGYMYDLEAGITTRALPGGGVSGAPTAPLPPPPAVVAAVTEASCSLIAHPHRNHREEGGRRRVVVVVEEKRLQLIAVAQGNEFVADGPQGSNVEEEPVVGIIPPPPQKILGRS